jgi:lipoprotein-releasing system permease protein
VANLAITRALGYPYWTRDWQQLNQNLLEAVQLEKVVIFFVVLVMVVAACFNISSTLFVTVLRRYSDISILRTMGATRGFILRLFSIQGMLVGLVGAIAGLLLGALLCWGFSILENQFGLLPGEIYKLSQFSPELRWFDLLSIFVVAFLICFISTLAPARRGAKLEAVEGLRYE